MAALLAVPIEETMLQANPHPVVAWSPDHAATGARASLAETPAQPESSSTRRAQREEAVGPTLVSHVGHRAKAMSFAIEVVDAVFARSEWPPDPLLSDQALVTLD